MQNDFRRPDPSRTTSDITNPQNGGSYNQNTDNSGFPSPETTNPQPLPVVASGRKKRHLGLFLTLLLLLVILAAGAGYLYKTSLNKPAANSTATTNSTAQTPKTTQTTDIVNLLTEASTVVSGGPVTHDVAAPDFMVAGYDFAAVGQKDDSSDVTVKKASADIAPTATKFENFLTSKDCKKSETQLKDTYYTLIKYENADTICGVSSVSSKTVSSNPEPVSLACALKSTYEATAKAQKPFYDAYRSAAKENVSSLGYPRLIDSRTRNYKTAEVSLYSEAQPTGALGLFYQTPDKKWHFFKGTQNTLPCSDFNTADLKKAYLGEPCMDKTQESSVQL
jgi:hypothetical protein